MIKTSIVITSLICLTIIAVVWILVTGDNESSRIQNEHEERMKELEKQK